MTKKPTEETPSKPFKMWCSKSPHWDCLAPLPLHGDLMLKGGP